MGTRYLLDTNAAIYLIKGSVPIVNPTVIAEASKEAPQLSVISKIGLLRWNAPTEAEAQKCQVFVGDSRIYQLSDEVAERTIWIRKLPHKPKLPDCIIAATAIVHDMVLLSRNESDFSKIPGLRLINPFATVKTS
ncbi:MAG: type II toxin-antitoxin system VapC family toxin [Saprospiraceae bacterium]